MYNSSCSVVNRMQIKVPANSPSKSVASMADYGGSSMLELHKLLRDRDLPVLGFRYTMIKRLPADDDSVYSRGGMASQRQALQSQASSVLHQGASSCEIPLLAPPRQVAETTDPLALLHLQLAHGHAASSSKASSQNLTPSTSTSTGLSTSSLQSFCKSCDKTWRSQRRCS